MTAETPPQPLRHEQFAPLVGERFTLTDGVIELQAELTEATLTPNVPEGWPTKPFALMFRGPAEPTLAQATYDVSHEQLGPEPIFLVPIAADAAGVRYQAIFN